LAVKNVAIYPADKHALPLVKYLEVYNPQMRIEALIAPAGTGAVGKDISVLDNREGTGRMVADSATPEALLRCTDLIILPGNPQEPRYVDSQRLIQSATQSGITIHNFCCPQPKLDFPREGALYQPKVPIIFVAGMLDIVNTTEIALGLGAAFKRNQYKVAVLAGDETSRLLGEYPVSSFLFEQSLTEVEKIVWLNKYIQHIAESAKPHVIIVQVPGGFERYSLKTHNTFGVYYYLISQAILPDAAVLCVPVNRCENKIIYAVNNACSKRFGFTFDAVHVSNVFIDPLHDENDGRINFMHDYPKRVEAVVAGSHENSVPLFNMIENDGINGAYECLLRRLT